MAEGSGCCPVAVDAGGADKQARVLLLRTKKGLMQVRILLPQLTLPEGIGL